MTNLTGIETIYEKRLKTITVKINRNVIAEHSESLKLTRCELVYATARAIFDTLDQDQEHFAIVTVNTSNAVRGYKIISSGSMSAACVDPKIVFRSAILLGARSLFALHNHPSGSLTPSPEDWGLTKLLVQAGAMLDLPLLDHLILAHHGYTSMRDERPSVFNA